MTLSSDAISPVSPLMLHRPSAGALPSETWRGTLLDGSGERALKVMTPSVMGVVKVEREHPSGGGEHEPVRDSSRLQPCIAMPTPTSPKRAASRVSMSER